MTGLGRLNHKRAFLGNENVECFRQKNLELAATEMLRRKAVSKRVTRIYTAQQAGIARLQSRME